MNVYVSNDHFHFIEMVSNSFLLSVDFSLTALVINVTYIKLQNPFVSIEHNPVTVETASTHNMTAYTNSLSNCPLLLTIELTSEL